MAPPPLSTGRVPSLVGPDVAVTLVPVRGQTAALVVRHAATEGRAEMNAVNVHKASLDRAARKVSHNTRLSAICFCFFRKDYKQYVFFIIIT